MLMLQRLSVLSLSFFVALLALGSGRSLVNPGATLWELELGSASMSFSVPLWVDPLSGLFFFTVSLISMSVFLFSYSYMQTDPHPLRFHLLVASFVGAMYLLILSPSLLSVLWGWDGLGVSSFLLVVYFQNNKALAAGLLTVLSNRIGDVALLSAAALIAPQSGWQEGLFQAGPCGALPGLLAGLLILAGFTKSAQIPFSAWLPAAMAAPTPVSALVHSSTLVTAGVYLLVRYSPLLPSGALGGSILGAGLATSFMAGLSALWEVDLKKVVALSTLSQLGLMVSALALQCPTLSFFHLIAHAFFKALLFVAVGSTIHLSASYQDVRLMGLSGNSLVTVSFAMVANISLCGFPFTAGFFSKDWILETSSLLAFPLYSALLLYGSISLTVAYSVRLIWLGSVAPSRQFPTTQEDDSDLLSHLASAVLGAASLFLTHWLTFKVQPLATLPPCPSTFKYLVLLLLGLGILLGSKQASGAWPSEGVVFSWGALWALPFLSSGSWLTNLMSFGHTCRKLDQSWLEGTLAPLTNGKRGLLSSDSFWSHYLSVNLLILSGAGLIVWSML